MRNRGGGRTFAPPRLGPIRPIRPISPMRLIGRMGPMPNGKRRGPATRAARPRECRAAEGRLLVLVRLLLGDELDRLGDFFIALALGGDSHRGEFARLALAKRLLVLQTVLDVGVF